MRIGRWIGWGTVGAALYAALAWVALANYVDPAPQGKVVVLLLRPFVHERGFVWRVGEQFPGDMNRLTGSFAVYEENQPLEQTKVDKENRPLKQTSVYSDVPPGRFMRDGNVIRFSTTGNPNQDRRRFWAVIP